jgi:hypothetical protein
MKTVRIAATSSAREVTAEEVAPALLVQALLVQALALKATSDVTTVERRNFARETLGSVDR